jgi:hypothetical protein
MFWNLQKSVLAVGMLSEVTTTVKSVGSDPKMHSAAICIVVKLDGPDGHIYSVINLFDKHCSR